MQSPVVVNTLGMPTSKRPVFKRCRAAVGRESTGSMTG